MSVMRLDEWRLAGCTDACYPRRHDPRSHESYGYRMAQENPIQTFYEIGSRTVDTVSETVTNEGAVVPLTSREWQVLVYLLRHADQWCSNSSITAHIWGSGPEHTLTINVSRMRSKLGNARDILLNRRGFGYMLRTMTKPLPVVRIAEPRTITRWARSYDACTWCKQTHRPHGGRGLCTRCYDRQKAAGKYL